MSTLNKTILNIFLLPSVFCLLSSTSQAHKVRIFAYGEGSTVVGEAAFSGGRAPKNSEIIVQDAATGRTLLTCRTDNQGHFRFPIPQEARRSHLDLRIIINVGEGHRGEWLLEAEEYLVDGEGKSASSSDRESVAVIAPARKTIKTVYADKELIRRMVEEAMDKKLGPIKRMLVEGRNQGPNLQDILGGIGYILGLAGIIAHFKSKTHKGERE